MPANLLKGPIAKLVASALKGAGMTLPATLYKVTPGNRTAGSISAGTNPTAIAYACRGFIDVYTTFELGLTTTIGVDDRKICLLGATIQSAQVPRPTDKIFIDGLTYEIVNVSRDPASATYECQARLSTLPTVFGQPVLLAVLADTIDPVLSGVAYAYTLSVTNAGSGSATLVTATITIPATTTFVSASGTGWSCSNTNGVVTGARDVLANGTASPITVVVTAPALVPLAGATLTCTSTVTASNFTGSVNNTQTTTCNPNATKDAASGLYFPASAAEFTALALPVPSRLYLCQEPSGDLADSIGGITLTASGTGLGYGAAVAGLTRKGVTFTDNGTGVFKSASASLPDLSSTSQLAIAVAKVTASGGNRSIATIGVAASRCGVGTSITPRLQGTSTPSNVINGTSDPTGALAPWLVQSNFTVGVTTITDGAEKLLPVRGSPAGKGLALGAVGTNSPTVTVVWMAVYEGAAAEMTDATKKSLLQTLGHVIAWT